MSQQLFPKNHEVVKEIMASLNRECQFQREYLRLIEEEKKTLHVFKPNDTESCAEKRSIVVEKIRAEQDARIAILKGILRKINTNRPELKLTAIAERVFDPEDTMKIKETCGILREMILLTKNKTKELEGMVSFSMKLVSGSISAILAQVQNSTPTYNSYGKLSHEVIQSRTALKHTSCLA